MNWEVQDQDKDWYFSKTSLTQVFIAPPTHLREGWSIDIYGGGETLFTQTKIESLSVAQTLAEYKTKEILLEALQSLGGDL